MTRSDPSEGRFDGPRARTAAGVLIAGLGGALLLAVAEFTPLLTVHTTATRAAVATVQTGSHHSYALLPIALLGALFSLSVWRTRNRLSLLATAVLGVVALLIALVRDLPSAQSTGLTSHYVLASSTPSAGLYLETLGAVLLLISGVSGLLLLAPPAPSPRRRRGPGPRPRSAS